MQKGGEKFMYLEIDFDCSKSKMAYTAVNELEKISEISAGPSCGWDDYRRKRADELYYKIAWTCHFSNLLEQRFDEWRESERFIESCRRRMVRPTEIEIDALVSHPYDKVGRETVKNFAVSDRQLAMFFARVEDMDLNDFVSLIRLQGKRRGIEDFDGEQALQMHTNGEATIDFIYRKDLPELACPVQY
jgi:hypothetical protein